MIKDHQKTFFVCLLVSLLLHACGQQKPVPEISSSAEFSGYAIEYPEDLEALAGQYKEHAASASGLMASFGDYPNQLKEPDWSRVLAIVERADEEGRGRAYSERMNEAKLVCSFIDREKDNISRRVNGSVKKAAEQAECECELDAYGKITYAVKDSVNRCIDAIH